MYEADKKTIGKFDYVEAGSTENESILLLHGLFGTASNFEHFIDKFRNRYHIVLPILPIFSLPLMEVSLKGMLAYIGSFIEAKGLKNFHVIGNSLGGHLALMLALSKQSMMKSLTLTGSSGLYEKAFGSSMPRRNNKDYVREKMKLTFYDSDVVTEEMVDEVYGIVNNRLTAIRIVKMAKSAIRNNLENELHNIKIRTLLIWGKQDTITPPFVGEKFNELIESSSLHFLDKCGHAPMLERPNEFNDIYDDFVRNM